MELYDEKNVAFLFVGVYTRQRFDELKRAQGLKFGVDQAPKNIVAFVQGLRQDNKQRFIRCTLIEDAKGGGSSCR